MGELRVWFRIRPVVCFEANQVVKPSFWEDFGSEVQENQALRLELNKIAVSTNAVMAQREWIGPQQNPFEGYAGWQDHHGQIRAV